MKRKTILVLALACCAIGTQAQFKAVKLADNTNAGQFFYNQSGHKVQLGPITHSGYQFALSANTTNQFAFLNTNFTDNAVIEYNASKQLRFQHWIAGVWNSTLLTLDLNSDNVAIGLETPTERLHLNGSFGLGKFASTNDAGLSVNYTDGGTGTTKFKHNRYGGIVTFSRNGPSGERKQLELGGEADAHYLKIYDGENEDQVHLRAEGTSYLKNSLAIGRTSILNPANKFELNGHGSVSGGHIWAFGDEDDLSGSLRIYNSPTHKLSVVDYMENFHIRRRGATGNNLGSVMGFQKDGSVTIGVWERYDGSVYGDGSYKLMVNGNILCERLKVIANVPNSDHVFEDDYQLMSLDEVESFVTTNKHLPEVPSAKEFQEEGYLVGEMDDLLLRKVEELTLYVIQLKKEIEVLKTGEETNVDRPSSAPSKASH